MLFVILIALTATLSTAQRTTPTPAPTKTATPVTSDPTSTPAADTPTPTVVVSDSPIDPFTQADLSVLTGNVQRPNGAVWYNGMLYTVCNGDWTIYELDIANRSTETYIFGLRNAHTLYAEFDEESQRLILWAGDFEQSTFGRITVNGVEQIARNLDGPWGVTPFGDDAFLVTNLLGNTIVQISRSGEVEQIADGLRSPAGIAADGEFVYVANNGSARRAIEWFTVDEENETPELNPLVSGLQSVTNLVLAADNHLYFTYALGTRGVVGRVDPEACRDNGGCSNDMVEIVIYTELDAPLAGLTISPEMELFVHTIYRPEIYYVDLDSTTRE